MVASPATSPPWYPPGSPWATPPTPNPSLCSCWSWRCRPAQLPLSPPCRSPFRGCLLGPPPTAGGLKVVTSGFIQLWHWMPVYLQPVPPPTQTPSPVKMGPVSLSLLFGCGGDFPQSPQALDSHTFTLWVCSCFLPGQVESTHHVDTRLGHVMRLGQSDISRRSPGQSGRGQHMIVSNGWLRRESTLDQWEEVSDHKCPCVETSGWFTHEKNRDCPSFHTLCNLCLLLFSHAVVSLCGPMDCSTPDFSVLHNLPEFAQTHAHWVSDAIQNHLILCCPLLLLPSIFPRIRVFSNNSALRIRWTKYWSFSFNISPSSECSGLVFLRMDWFDLLAVQGTLKSFLQH